jgi:hypothetical protein
VYCRRFSAWYEMTATQQNPGPVSYKAIFCSEMTARCVVA